MLIFTAYAMVAVFMTLIMTRRLSAMVALIAVPLVTALFLGFADRLGPMMIEGVKDIAPTGIMLIFAILYFGIMIDAGLFTPLICLILRLAHDDPVRINIGAVALALIVGLDGDGSTTYMITIATILPLYRKLRLDVRMLACLAIMASGISNMLPWGGPVARAAAVLHLDAARLFLASLPAMLAATAWLLGIAIYFGRAERRRLAEAQPPTDMAQEDGLIGPGGQPEAGLQRPRLWWLNLALTIGLLVLLIVGTLPLAALFMIALCAALTINYPSIEQQRERIYAHAGNALSVGGLVFAAGIFIGILNGTGMVSAMAKGVIDIIPAAGGPYLALVTALVSIPFTFLISNDAFYFGMLPILAEAGRHYGFSTTEMALASLVGQQVHLLSPLVPSTYLLVGMVGIEIGEHQRFTIKWALGSAAVFLAIYILTGAFPLMRG